MTRATARPLCLGLLALAALALGATPAAASTILLSDESSDATDPMLLDATLEFEVVGNQLTITLTNPDDGDDPFNVSMIWFNAAANVSGLTLLSATHSAAGDVAAEWGPVETNTMVDGFGMFDFGLTDGTGATSDAIVMPTESVVFVLDISGTGPFDMNDFKVENADGYLAAAMFVNGPDDPENPGNEDSAFGAAVPEPTTGLLLGFGMVGLAHRRRRSR